MEPEIISLNVGVPAAVMHQGREIRTGIHKHPTDKRLYLSTLNLDGDGQADPVNHGGKDKAICVYPHEHYAYWEKELNRRLDFGAFGENLTVCGMQETDVCIGDIFRLGEAVVQVSQPRQPCYKLGVKHDWPDLPLRVQNTGFTGYYVRVLQEGFVDKNSSIRLLQRHPKGITVSFVNHVKYHDKENEEAIQRILEVEELAEGWRQSFAKRLVR